LENKYSLLADRINENGIRHAFGVPGGGESLKLIDALNHANIPFYRTHHEAAAAIMAGTIGKLTGNPGLSISIKGPGLTNMMPGIAFCNFENFPMIAISESYDEKSKKIFGHKGIDQSELVSRISKGSIYYNNRINRFQNAFDLSIQEIPGPVVLNLAKGEKRIFSNRVFEFNQNSIKNLYSIIKNSKKPIIIFGSSAYRFGFSEKLSKLDLPIFTTLSSKGMLNENLNYSAGIYTGAGRKKSPEFFLFEKSDLIIGIGIDDNELLNSDFYDCESINFSLSKSEITNKFNHNVFCSIEEIDEFIYLLSAVKWGKNEIKKTRESLNKYFLNDDSFLPSIIYENIEKHFNNNYRIILDTGYFSTVAEHYFLSKNIDSFICAANSRYMGTSIPMGIASSLYDTSVPSIIFVGDGGIGMYISEMKIAAENKLPILVVLLSDGGFGSIRKRSISNGLTQSPIAISNPSWNKHFESFGIKSCTVKSLNTLNKVLDSWQSGPLFIECFFDKDLYMNMVNDLRE
tara:strand:+ start:38898 stop:40445 length:1548 start_codon:yes stop_codon:yes gene_type:complete